MLAAAALVHHMCVHRRRSGTVVSWLWSENRLVVYGSGCVYEHLSCLKH